MKNLNICIYYLHEVYPIKGGISRVSSLLESFFSSVGFRVYFLSSEQRYKDFSHPENQHYISPEDECGFLKFLEEKKINVFINQSGGVPRFPYTTIPRHICIVSVLHFCPFFYPEDILYLKISSSSWGKLIPAKRFISNISFVRKLFDKLLSFRLRFLYGKEIERSDRFVLLSERYKSDLEKILYKLPKKVCAIPNPTITGKVEVDLIRKKKEIIWVGRMSFGQKRPDWMLKIWEKLENRFPEWAMRFVGEGEYLQELKEMSKRLSCSRVYFEGYQSPEAYYRDASIVCMTSTFEGAPMVLREAVMYACVPVAFNSFSSASEVILDGETGFLVPAFDLNRYVEILAILMTDEVLRKKIALAAKHRGSNWSIERVGSAWVNLFKEISEEKRSEKEV